MFRSWLLVVVALGVLAVGSSEVHARTWMAAHARPDAAPEDPAGEVPDAGSAPEASAPDGGDAAAAVPPVLAPTAAPTPASEASAPRAPVPSPEAEAVPVPAADAKAPPGLIERITGTIADPTLGAGVRAIVALFMFLVGWLLVRMISRSVLALSRRLLADPRLVDTLGLGRVSARPTSEGEGPPPWRLEDLLAQAVYYLLLLLLAIGVLEIAGVAESSGRLRRLLDMVLHALPLIGHALLTLIIAFVIGRVLQSGVTRFLERMHIDSRLPGTLPPVPEGTPAPAPVTTEAPLSERIGRIAFWLAMSFGLMSALEVLDLGEVSGPLRRAIERITDFLPVLGGAALLLLGGYLLGRMARAVVRNLLESAGFNRLMARLKLDKPFRTITPSQAVANLTMLVILLQAGIAALNLLEVRSLANPLTGMMERFYSVLPGLGLAIVIATIGVLVGRLVRRWVDAVLKNIGFDRLMERIGLGKLRGQAEGLSLPSELLAFVAQCAVILLAAAQALEAVQLRKWAGYLEAILTFGAERLAVAALLIVIGFGVGTSVREMILARRRAENEESMTWIAAAARWGVLVFAFTIAIHQLGVAEQFVRTGFVLLFGGLCLALALAFGLGARDVAGEIVRRQVERTRATPRPAASEKDAES